MSVLLSVTRKKSPNVYKSCLKMISLEKWKILTHLQKLPINLRDLGKLMFPKALKSCPKSNKLPDLVTLIIIQWRKNNLIFQQGWFQISKHVLLKALTRAKTKPLFVCFSRSVPKWKSFDTDLNMDRLIEGLKRADHWAIPFGWR